MPTIPKRVVSDEKNAEIEQALKDMVLDAGMKTTSTYSTNVTDYPDNLIPFVQKHIAYLQSHPKVDADQYLANLRLMIKVRA